MYVSMKEMLQHASVNNYAVPAPNCPSYALVKAACMAAAEKKSAVILDVSPRQMRMNATPEVWAPMVKAIAEPLNVPVALNLDHGGEFEDICRCIKAGFSSVMCDASALPFEENIRRVQQVVTFAHAHGVSVEAELGHVGQAAEGDGRSDDMYTKVDMAVEFVERTGCDSLAIAIGTSHGAYKFKPGTKPQLRFDILEDVEKRLPGFPIVLHGSSSVPQEFVRIINENGGNMPGAIGVPEDQLRKAASMAVCKINIDSDLRLAMTASIRKYFTEHPDHFDPRQYLGPGREAIKEMVKHKIVDVLGCDGKA